MVSAPNAVTPPSAPNANTLLTTSDLRAGDVIAVHGTGVIDVGIEWITHSPVSHVAIVANVADGARCIEAQAFRTVGYEAIATYAGHSHILRCPDISDAQRLSIVQFAHASFGVKYDYDGILREFERYAFHVKDRLSIDPHEGAVRDYRRYICSTLVALAYLSVGVRLTDVGLASPNDINVSPRLDVIGRI